MATPTGFQVASASSSNVSLSWNAVTDSAATSGITYRVERALSGGSPSFAAVGTGLTGTSFSDTTVEAGKTYQYRVRAGHAWGGSPYTAELQAVVPGVAPPAPVPPGIPADFTAVAGESLVDVSWTPVRSAQTGSYELERSTTSASAGFARLVTVARSPFRDTTVTDGRQYWYRMRARTSAGASGYTAAIGVTPMEAMPDPPAPMPPGAPAFLSATPSDTVVEVSLVWGAVTSSLAVTYQLERSSTSGTAGFSLLVSTSAANYLDETVENNRRYWYRVRAVTSAGAGAYAAVAVANVMAVLPTPDPPVVISPSDDALRGKDFRWSLRTNESRQRVIPIRAQDILEFSFQYGARTGEFSPPTAFYGYGELNLGIALSKTDAAVAHELLIEENAASMRHRYFLLAVRSLQVDRLNGSTALRLETLGARIKDEFGSYSVPGGKATIPNLNVDGIRIREDAAARIRPVQFSTPKATGVIGDITTTIGRLVNYFEGTGLCVAIEDINCDPPCWRLLPMPITSTSDTRSVVNRHYSKANAIPLRRGLRHKTAPSWRADELLFDSFRGDVSRDRTRPVRITGSDGQLEGSLRRWKARLQVTDRKWRDLSGNPLVDQKSPRNYVVDSHRLTNIVSPPPNLITRYFHSNTVIEWSTDQRNTVISSSFRFDVDVEIISQISTAETPQRYLANSKTARKERFISVAEFVVFAEAANLLRMQDLIDAWDDWRPELATSSWLPISHHEHDVVRRVAGERVAVTAGDIDHYCTILGVSWRLKGNNPLIVKWDLVLQGER
ncbi:MAG: hypothetical protein OXE52_11585 [Chloroflexi bacterium]|nr:hypothetical protein [Chloroflexota bacterium]